MMEDARNDGFLEDAQIFSLSEKAHASVPGPSRLLTTHLHDLSDGDLETALEDCLLSQFSIDHTCDLIIARGDPANIADYNRYLQIKDILRSRFENAMQEDDEQAMHDAAYGPSPSQPTIGILLLLPPLHAHDIIALGPQGPYPSVSLTAPNTNV